LSVIAAIPGRALLTPLRRYSVAALRIDFETVRERLEQTFGPGALTA
jgi:hypothetical protein